MSRNQRPLARRPNPLRDLVTERNRAAEIARNRTRAETLGTELPAIIQDRVSDHIQKLETKLLKDFKAMGQRAIDESTNVLNEQFNDRLETLEQISAIQSRTIVNLRDSSRIADEKVSTVVNSLEKTLAVAVPGFKLEPSAFSTPLLAASGTQVVKATPREMEEMRGHFGYCPKCTSTNVRRANRNGVWEEFLRLFFIAPFRCRACRHKFYKF